MDYSGPLSCEKFMGLEDTKPTMGFQGAMELSAEQ